ncbi:MAG: sensor histidine kinase [Bryobacteraceae bacterium]
MPRKLSISVNLTLWYAAFLTASLALFGGLLWFSLRSRLESGIDQDLADRGARVEKYFRTESMEANVQLRDELEEFCQALPPASYLRLRGAHGFEFRYPSGALPSGRMRAYRRRFRFRDEDFELELGAPLGDVDRTLNMLRLLLMGWIPVVIAVACLGGAWLSRRALKPVREATAAALTIGIENLSQRLPVAATGDEIAHLAEGWNSMLERLEKAVRTLSQFTADASHELRTPLAVVRTTAELALQRARTAESYRQSLAEIVAETARMTRLVEDLLFLARADTARADMPLEPIDVRDVLTGVCTEMRGLAEMRQVGVVCRLGDAEAIVSGNPAALHRLFLVLLDNALKYSRQGGTVMVNLERSGQKVSIAVEDSGAGIQPADLPHIFERFYRAEGSRGDAGHGLGLSLAQSIARAHGAAIEVTSRPGAGSKFQVTFELRAAPRRVVE